jgi:hypothetical protein
MVETITFFILIVAFVIFLAISFFPFKPRGRCFACSCKRKDGELLLKVPYEYYNGNKQHYYFYHQICLENALNSIFSDKPIQKIATRIVDKLNISRISEQNEQQKFRQDLETARKKYFGHSYPTISDQIIKKTKLLSRYDLLRMHNEQ